jgi:zinc-binding alcohol dehydrogenase family protein
MKAVGYFKSLPINHPESLLDLNLPTPTPLPRDLLIEVKAIAVNPVDLKIRNNVAPAADQAKVLGWDAVGVVLETGSDVSLFKAGDEVWYAGAIDRAGSNSQYQIVDERIVALMPQSLSFAQAAAMPLTSITAWELLFDRLGLDKIDTTGQSLLIIGAAGGVGSIAVQLAKQLTKLKVIGTASRPESQQWITQLGADHTINHQHSLSEQLAALGIPEVDYVISLTHSDDYFSEIVKILKPQGKFALIDDPKQAIDIREMKRKSLSLHWESMFTRSLFGTADMIKQHELLSQVAKLVDQGVLKTTWHDTLGVINVANLKRAHAMIESNTTIGKLVLEGFEG